MLDEEFSGWGVLAFLVGDLPAQIARQGRYTVYHFLVRNTHSRLKNNYPHSEVRAYRDDVHIDAKNEFLLDPPIALACWRQLLIWKIRIVIWPNQSS